MHKLYLALRYLRKRRIAFFGMAAVALCVALLIVITSLFDGFLSSLDNYWRDNWGEIILFPNYPLHPWGQLVDQLEQLPEVKTAQAVTNIGALLYLGRGNVRGVELQGVDFQRQFQRDKFRRGLLLPAGKQSPSDLQLSPEIRDKFRKWYQRRFRRSPRPEDYPAAVVMGIGILARPNELSDKYDCSKIRRMITELDTPMFITTGRQGLHGDGDAAILRKIRKTCWPVNVVQTGINFSDTHNVYISFDYLRDLMGNAAPDGTKQCLAKVQINLQTGIAPDKALEAIRQCWYSFARDKLHWSTERIRMARIFQSMQMPRLKLITHEIRKQLSVMQLMMGFICMVAALLIFVILFMIVMQKRKDIGIMRSVGASRSSIAGLFLLYGGGIGLCGSALGLLLGSWATRNINFIEDILTKLLGFKIWKSGVYFFSDIPNQVAWSAVHWIILAGIATAMLGTLLPAIRAARLQPVEALRYE